MATLFWVRLEFPDTSLAPMPVLAVARLGLPPSLATFHGLIGRDLIRHWEFLLIEGRRGRFVLRDAYTGLPRLVSSLKHFGQRPVEVPKGTYP